MANYLKAGKLDYPRQKPPSKRMSTLLSASAYNRRSDLVQWRQQRKDLRGTPLDMELLEEFKNQNYENYMANRLGTTSEKARPI